MAEQLTIDPLTLNHNKQVYADNIAAPSEASEDLTARRGGAAYYDTLLWRLRSRIEGEAATGYIIAVTSCARRCGVSTVAANLAIRAADHHMTPVLLVDANLRFARQHRAFRIKEKSGLADILIGDCPPTDAICKSKFESLDVLPLGSSDRFERARISAERVELLTKWMRENYSTIVLDLPEVSELRHALLLARKADTALFVIRAESVRRSEARKSISMLVEDGIQLGGVILTRTKTFAPKWLVG